MKGKSQVNQFQFLALESIFKLFSACLFICVILFSGQAMNGKLVSCGSCLTRAGESVFRRVLCFLVWTTLGSLLAQLFEKLKGHTKKKKIHLHHRG